MSLVIPLHRHHLSEEIAATASHEVVETLAQQLAATAVERDRAGGHAARERDLIRQSGLLTLTIPVAHGGQGGDWSSMYRVMRRLAEVDSALAHLFGFHHLQLAGVRLYGTPEQQASLLRDTVVQGWFWGNALNPLDRRLRATAVDGGYLLQGVKSFASGSVGSDQLTISAWHEPTQSLLIGVVPTHREGVRVQADWDAFGQKQTDSGSVTFDDVLIADHEVLQAPGTPPSPKATLRSQVAQLVLANLYLGIGLGAFNEARRYSREEARPWFAAQVDRAVDDPFVQRRYADLWLLLRPAAALADSAGALLDQAFRRGDALSDAERGEVAIAVAEAKVLAHRAGLEVSSQLFELTGARSTSARHGFDRFWRNVRVHTLHDPVDYKLRDIGRHVLTGAWPEPTAYS
ncbi:acyl-CoA dehydrogenase family protein [Rhizobacter sp. LjRoot28]|jgi:alkylation response protein AidB-like acyl-CoA dehydrogenase|uniref:acyl-CoA dehydrogenase family protein n=1 Tax=Rhizobacter sp. LjRoot28 TaxID=3342309 RepID=UPI003ECCA1DF